MKQIKKGLSKRDRILLVLLALVVVGVVYYFLVYKPTTERIAALQAQQAQVQTEIDALTTKAALLAKMKNELPGLQESNKAVAAYDNLKPVMAALNGIMMPSQEFDITFSTQSLEEGGDLIRRDVKISFLCENYARAKRIINDLDDIAFRCQISSVSITSEGQTGAGGEADLNQGAVRGAVSITFFETV